MVNSLHTSFTLQPSLAPPASNFVRQRGGNHASLQESLAGTRQIGFHYAKGT
ncbi:MAG TPA: hypothetical protein VFT49_02870 [Candidatus Saccharimonadales bacterium]|nr:hypothetical protein [Candidatus Saccharimonadales bacterium]